MGQQTAQAKKVYMAAMTLHSSLAGDVTDIFAIAIKSN